MYFIKRLLLFIPTVLVISLLSFYISLQAPGDPVELLVQATGGQAQNSQNHASQQYKDSLRAKLGLTLPFFYFSVRTASDCDTLYKIVNQQEQYALHRLSRTYGNWQYVSAYSKALKKLNQQAFLLNADTLKSKADALYRIQKGVSDSVPVSQHTVALETITQNLAQVQSIAIALKNAYNPKHIKSKLDTLSQTLKASPFLASLGSSTSQLEQTFLTLQKNKTTSPNYSPKFSWYGTNNQYHKWLINVLHGSFGYSYTDGRPVAEKIWAKFVRSFILILLSVVLAYGVSIPLGLYCAKHHQGFIDRFSGIVVFTLYAIPPFLFGTLLLFLFANPAFFNWFPESGYCDPLTYNPKWTMLEYVYNTFPYMMLPLITYTYTSFAYLSRIVRSASLEIMQQDFVRTARAKGLSEKQIMWRHVLRNSLLPIITTFVNILPAAIGGTVIVETIFSYDGMGIAGYEAILNKDYPMLVSVFTLAGLMSVIAYFIADILYAIVDPRIRFK